MLQIAMAVAFTVSELLRENPPTQIRVKVSSFQISSLTKFQF